VATERLDPTQLSKRLRGSLRHAARDAAVHSVPPDPVETRLDETLFEPAGTQLRARHTVTLSTDSEGGTASASRRGRTTPSQVDLQSAGATDWEARSSVARRLVGSDGYPPLTGRIAPVM
jgi:hypothetical protein